MALGPHLYIQRSEVSKELFASRFFPVFLPDLFLQGPPLSQGGS